MHKKYQCGYRFGNEYSGEKRLIFANGPDTRRQPEAVIPHEKIGEDRISKHRGKTADTAQKNADEMLKTSESRMNTLKDEWNAGLLRKMGNLGSMVGLGKLFNIGDKSQVRKLIEDAAEKRVAADVGRINEKGFEATAHAQDSIAILNHRIAAAKELAGNLERDIREKEKLRDAYRNSVRWLSQSGIGALKDEIKQSKKIRQFAETIREEYEGKKEGKNEKTQRIQQLEKSIIDFAISQGNPEDRPVLETALKEAVLKGSSGSEFLQMLSERGFKRGDYQALKGMVDNLLKGEGRFGIYSFTKADVQQYFSRKVLQEKVDKLNDEKETTQQRLQKLDQVPLGTKIKIGVWEYYLLKRETKPKGYLLKSTSENDHYAYINVDKPEKPIFTEELLGQEKGNFLPPKILEKNDQADEGTYSINFKAMEPVQSQPTPAPAPSAGPQAAPQPAPANPTPPTPGDASPPLGSEKI